MRLVCTRGGFIIFLSRLPHRYEEEIQRENGLRVSEPQMRARRRNLLEVEIFLHRRDERLFGVSLGHGVP